LCIERKYQRINSNEQKQMWKIIEEKGLTDKAFEIEKNRERRPCIRSMEVTDLETDEKMFFFRGYGRR